MLCGTTAVCRSTICNSINNCCPLWLCDWLCGRVIWVNVNSLQSDQSIIRQQQSWIVVSVLATWIQHYSVLILSNESTLCELVVVVLWFIITAVAILMQRGLSFSQTVPHVDPGTVRTRLINFQARCHTRQITCFNFLMSVLCYTVSGYFLWCLV